MSKHTPGPWKIEGKNIVKYTEFGRVLNIEMQNFSIGDLHLVCAAPDLLNALKLLANEDNYLEPDFDPCEIACVAIAKTRGNT